MNRALLILVSLAFLGAGLAACGGGGGGGGGTPPPSGTLSITGVVPPGGSVQGGTPITVSGTAFAAGATVTVGGTAATGVSVGNDTTITCTTPAGAAGAADVVVTVGADAATLAGAFTYAAAPTIATVLPNSGPDFGGTVVSLDGTGFDVPGTPTVTFGGVPATNVTVDNDTSITCTTPAGAGPVQVVVTNASGTTNPAAPFDYFAPILAAEGGFGPIHTLYAIDVRAASPAVIPVGDPNGIGFGVLGMDFDAAGTLYAVTDPATTSGVCQLATIDVLTGVGTLIAPTNDLATINQVIPDMSFVGGTLYATNGLGGPPSLFTINTGSGLVTATNLNLFAGLGSAFAADSTTPTPLVYYMTADTAPLFSVTVTATPPAASFTPSAFSLNGFSLAPGDLVAATYHQGMLYGLDSVVGPGARHLVTVNTTTGALTPVPVVLSPNVEAITSSTR